MRARASLAAKVSEVPSALGFGAALLCTACAPEHIELAGFEEAAFIAALSLDAHGEIAAGTEVRPFRPGESIDLYTADLSPLALVAWRAGAFDGAAPTAAVVHAREGCEPRLPRPEAAMWLEESGAGSALDPATLPWIAVDWAEPLCPDLDLSRLAFHTRCAEARCPWAIERTTSCGFALAIEGCLIGSITARVEPDGTLCATRAEPGQPPSCSSVEPNALATATFECSDPRACAVDVYVTPEDAPLSVTKVALLDVAPYRPDVVVTGSGREMPPCADLIGYAHDMAVVGDRVLVSTTDGALIPHCRTSTGPTVLRAYALEDLTLLDTRAGAPGLMLLAGNGTSALGLSVVGERFELAVYDRDLVRTRAVELDARVAAAPGEPPPARVECERPTDLIVEGERVYAIVERGERCPGPGAIIHVFDRRTLGVIGRRMLPSVAPRRARIYDGDLWISDDHRTVVDRYRLADLEVVESYEVPTGVGRAAVFISDFARDSARGELVVATVRQQPALWRGPEPRRFEQRAFFLPHETDPTGVWADPVVGGRGLVMGTRDTDPGIWSTEVALLDRERFLILPGSAAAGHGPPRRLLSDGRGGILALMPWEGTLLRLRAFR